MVSIWITLSIFLIFASTGIQGCDPSNFQKLIGTGTDDYMIYGITQDCQMFFIRSSQVQLLSNVRINRRHSFCFSNLVQLHLKSHDSLLLTFKQASNRICTLDIHIPSFDMLFGDHLFRYSLLNSLRYASCSHSTDNSFQLEPDLSFMDPIYKDVVYFVDSLSTGPKWKVLQFLLKDSGNFNMMNNLTIDNSFKNKNTPASEFMVSIDAQRDKLYKWHKYENIMDYQCSFDMLFNPKEAVVKEFKVEKKGFGGYKNSQSIDGELMVYVETDQTTIPEKTRLNIMNIHHPDDVFCLTTTTFAYEIGIIRASTLKKLKDEPLPPFGTKMTPRPTSFLKATTEAPLKTSAKTTTVSVSKPKGSYSPSKMFFKYETGSSTNLETSTVVYESSEFSNEIPNVPDDSNEDEDVEELNEIIKELKDENENVGEMRTSEPVTAFNDTARNASDAAAFNGKRSREISYLTIFLSVFLFFSCFQMN